MKAYIKIKNPKQLDSEKIKLQLIGFLIKYKTNEIGLKAEFLTNDFESIVNKFIALKNRIAFNLEMGGFRHLSN